MLSHKLTPKQYWNGTRSENVAVARTISQRYETGVVGMDFSEAKQLLESLGWIVFKYDPNAIFGGDLHLRTS